METMKPILFNTDMVRAILEGRKTVTRRVVRLKELDEVLSSPVRKENPDVPDSRFIECLCTAPYEAGDILWVRETWCESLGWAGIYFYRAYAGPRDEMKEYAHSFNRWRPNIHMPREAARIFLRVTDVRVERLQDMRLKDCKKEGVQLSFVESADLVMGPIRARERFSSVWDSTIKPADLSAYGWAANPWVWVIMFERVGKEEVRI